MSTPTIEAAWRDRATLAQPTLSNGLTEAETSATASVMGLTHDSEYVAELQARAQVQGEPVYWEWRHLSTHPDTVDFGQWSKWQRVEARSAIHTIDDALAEFRAYIAQGYKYELRALYDHPAPSVPADVMRDAERGRFLLEWLKRYGLLQAEFGQMGVGEKPENWWLLHAPWGIDKTRPFFGHGKTPEQAIDAAMLAAK